MGEEEKSGGGERRKYIRYACKTELKAIIDFNPDVARRSHGKLPPVVFRSGETAVVRNISKKGIAFELEHFLPEGMTIKLAIENPITPPIQTGARVSWVKKLPKEKGYVMGLAYRYMREKHRRNLNKLVEFLWSIPD